MAKKFTFAPGVEILFDRRVTCEVKAPKSGRMVKIEDDAPDILAVAHADATTYYERDGDAWTPLNGVGESVQLVGEFDAADEVKRAPKF